MALVEQIPAETYLIKRCISFDVRLHTPSDTALAEARALYLRPSSVLKTVMLKIGDEFAIAVTPASRRVDLRKLRLIFKKDDVRLATEAEIQDRYPEYDLGALPPLPGLLGVVGFIDNSVMDLNVVAFADGRQTESMTANPRALFWGEKVFVGPITRNPEEELRFEGDSIDVSE